MKIAFLLYPTHKIKTDEDTSFWIMHELALRSHSLYHFESSDLFYHDHQTRAYLSQSRLDPKRGFVDTRRSSNACSLSMMDVVIIRKEPPFDTEYLYALQLLSLLNKKVRVMNDPTAIAMCNEKLFILNFQTLTPELLVTSSLSQAGHFIRTVGSAVVLKPLNNKGGAGILKTSAKDRNLYSLLEASMDYGTRKIMIQKYIPQNEQGDKRILLLNGEILGCFIRKPSKKDFRANLSVGGSMHKAALTRRDKQISEAVGRECLERGLYFVGLDVIGPYLSEINVTSPSGAPELKKLTGRSIEKNIADFIERGR